MAAVRSSIFPELRTHRFLLRQIVAADAPTIFKGLSDPRVIAHYGVSYESLEATRRQMAWFEQIYAEDSGIWWGICEPHNRTHLMGATGLNNVSQAHRRGELGYWLLPEYWGRGIAQECVVALLAYAFDTMALHRIGAEVESDNHRSLKLLEQLGFQCEGIRRDYELKQGTFVSLKDYSLLSTDPCR